VHGTIRRDVVAGPVEVNSADVRAGFSAKRGIVGYQAVAKSRYLHTVIVTRLTADVEEAIRDGSANCRRYVTGAGITLSVNCMESAAEVAVITIVMMRGYGFGCIITADILACGVTVVRRSVPVTVTVNVRIVASVHVAETVDIHVRPSDRLAVGLGILGGAGIVAPTFGGVLGIRAIVVAISVPVVPADTIAVCLPIHRRFYSIALPVDGMECTVELAVVAELAGCPCNAGLRESSADVGARCGSVGGIDSLVTFRLDEKATFGAEVSGSVVVAGFVCRGVAPGKFCALCLGINFRPEKHEQTIYVFINSFIYSLIHPLTHSSLSGVCQVNL